jgi:hypothetical protein
VRLANDTIIELAAGASVQLDTSNVLWVLHDGTITIMLSSSAGSILHVSAVSLNGSWSRVTQGPDDVVSIPTFLMFVEHGMSFEPAFTAYAQLPGAFDDVHSADAVAAQFVSSLSHSRYDDAAPFICRSQGNSSLVWMVVGAFFQPSAAPFIMSVPGASCPSVATSAACAFMVALHVSGVMSVTISNPNRESATDSIVVEIQGVQASGPFCAASASGTAVTVKLPSGLDLGGSSTVSCSTV